VVFVQLDKAILLEIRMEFDLVDLRSKSAPIITQLSSTELFHLWLDCGGSDKIF
jgi:hypothetical protein